MNEFAKFCSDFKPLMQPEGTVPRARRSLGINSAYCEAFRRVRTILRPELNRWPEAMVLQINQNRDLSEKLDMVAMDQFRKMFATHIDAVLGARFDSDYFDTIEDLTLFFIHLDLRAVWMIGGLKAVMADSLCNIFDHRDAGRRNALIALFDFYALELSQVQRVYIRFAEVRFNRTYDASGDLTLSS